MTRLPVRVHDISEMKPCADILVVEDDTAVRSVLCAALEREGHTVRQAEDGQDCLRLVEEKAPDLILCDYQMPRMNGIDVLRRVRGNGSTRHIPFVLVTGMRDRRCRLEGIEAGADDYLNKPLDLAELFARTRALLHTKRLDDEVRRQREVIESLLAISSANPSYGGDRQRIIGDFVRRTSELLRAGLVAAIAVDRSGEVHILACHPAERGEEILRRTLTSHAWERMLEEGTPQLVPIEDEILQRMNSLSGGFAGVPLRDMRNQRVGGIVAHELPANPTLETLRILQTLAHRVSSELQLQHYNEELESTVAERTGALRETLSQLSVAKEALERAHEETVFRLALAAEFRDNETANHLRRMSRFSEVLALAVGLGVDEAKSLRCASLMHDIGKIAIPDDILQKPGRLSEAEYEQMKNHTVYGAEICRGSEAPLLQMGETVALGHHERWDGSGYPRGRLGEEIPREARIVAVADVFDALISRRRYKAAWSLDEAMEHLASIAGTHLDPELVAVFTQQRPRVEAIVADLPDPEEPGEQESRTPHALR